MIHNLGATDSLVSGYVAEIRDASVQQDRMRFRQNMERLGSLIAYELSKTLTWKDKLVTTPLGTVNARELSQQPVVCSILRAGLAMHHGVLHAFDKADSGFISAYRKHDDDGNFIIRLGYITCPRVDNRVLIMVDPMLATGQSAMLSTNEVLKLGKPSELHIISAIAAEPGIKLLREELPDVHIWAAAIDPELDDRAFIVPGLGDAGDLAFGPKLQA